MVDIPRQPITILQLAPHNHRQRGARVQRGWLKSPSTRKSPFPVCRAPLCPAIGGGRGGAALAPTIAGRLDRSYRAIKSYSCWDHALRAARVALGAGRTLPRSPSAHRLAGWAPASSPSCSTPTRYTRVRDQHAGSMKGLSPSRSLGYPPCGRATVSQRTQRRSITQSQMSIGSSIVQSTLGDDSGQPQHSATR